MSSTQVLIAGGGPVGLAAAVELGQRGIECVVIEPRATVSHARPRCKTINVRSMEHLRRWGIADRLRERAPLPVAWSQDIVFCTSLTGHELSRFSGVLGLCPEDGRCPEPGQQAPQYVLEELLREVTDELPSVTLATGRRVTGLEQDEDEVRVAVTDATGHDRVIAAAYVLGCDGPRSAVRTAIGAEYVGEHALRPNFGMVFHAPELLERTIHGPAVQYWILNRIAPALMGPGEVGERARRRAHTTIQAAKRAEFHALTLVLDLAYEHSPVIVANGLSPELGDDDDPVREARPGARLPHVWLGPDRSLYDELGSGLTLLVLGDDRTGTFERAARGRAVPLRVVALDAALRDRYRTALILVRPDQHVAWCSDRMPDDVGAVIDRVRGAPVVDRIAERNTSTRGAT